MSVSLASAAEHQDCGGTGESVAMHLHAVCLNGTYVRPVLLLTPARKADTNTASKA